VNDTSLLVVFMGATPLVLIGGAYFFLKRAALRRKLPTNSQLLP